MAPSAPWSQPNTLPFLPGALSTTEQLFLEAPADPAVPLHQDPGHPVAQRNLFPVWMGQLLSLQAPPHALGPPLYPCLGAWTQPCRNCEERVQVDDGGKNAAVPDDTRTATGEPISSLCWPRCQVLVGDILLNQEIWGR